ncbi:DUF5682 family protein [Aestuariimicrobium sp. Y1814]|uniref:DUF5682 family protein n=1 Tax=Aestuariimicrobium sp. Y1814 TaxID=3418742 RepID=UPI003DA776EA
MTEATQTPADVGRVEFFGVRHHSPTAARLVAERIAADPPAAVLIEGPTEFNDQLDELALPHELPIMIYSWAPLHPDAEEGSTAWAARRAGFYPLCDYSPEWTAFRTARAHEVPTAFIDLPWLALVDIAQSENRFAEPEPDGADRPDAQEESLEALYRAVGVDRIDTLFDELLEVDPGLGLADYQQRTEIVGSIMRRLPPDEETRHRETFMAARITDTLASVEGTVLVVCGAAHLGGLRAELARPSDPIEVWAPPPDDERYGIALTPTSYVALDALDGYNAGQPTPGFYDLLWHDRAAGRSDTVERMLRDIAAELRAAKQFVSPADLIATLTTARGLSALRGHPQVWRTDLVDAMTTTLVKDDTGEQHPLLHRARLVMRGDKLGRLAEGTRQPPLVAEIRRRLAAHELEPHPGRAQEIDLDLTATSDLQVSQLLHSLRVLDIEVTRLQHHADQRGVERWRVAWTNNFEPSMVMAAQYGATLEAAVTARLLDRAANVTADSRTAIMVLFDAVLCGVAQLASTLQERTAAILSASGDIAALGEALDALMELYRYDRLRRTTGRTDIGRLVAVSFDRCLRLVEQLGRLDDGPALAPVIATIKAVTDAAERVGESLGLDTEGWDAALAGLVDDPDQAAGLRGAALGARWLTGAAPDEQLAAMVRLVHRADLLGDFMAGLLTVAREAALRRPELLLELDRLLSGFSNEDFMDAVPGLRRAFSRYPPRDRARVAELVLGEQAELALDRFSGSAEDALAVAAFEADLAATLVRFLGEEAWA